MTATELYRQHARLVIARHYRSTGDADMAGRNLAAARFWRRCSIEQKWAEHGISQGRRLAA